MKFTTEPRPLKLRQRRDGQLRLSRRTGRRQGRTRPALDHAVTLVSACRVSFVRLPVAGGTSAPFLQETGYFSCIRLPARRRHGISNDASHAHDSSAEASLINEHSFQRRVGPVRAGRSGERLVRLSAEPRSDAFDALDSGLPIDADAEPVERIESPTRTDSASSESPVARCASGGEIRVPSSRRPRSSRRLPRAPAPPPPPRLSRSRDAHHRAAFGQPLGSSRNDRSSSADRSASQQPQRSQQIGAQDLDRARDAGAAAGAEP